MDLVIWEWVSFAARWLHVVTAIAWIGSSFYFVALDLGLRKAAQAPAGVGGEAWQVHGGGFYHIQKYMVAPARMPEELTWFKWESYGTWLSGFFLMGVVYYLGAELEELPVPAALGPLVPEALPEVEHFDGLGVVAHTVDERPYGGCGHLRAQ